MQTRQTHVYIILPDLMQTRQTHVYIILPDLMQTRQTRIHYLTRLNADTLMESGGIKAQ